MAILTTKSVVAYDFTSSLKATCSISWLSAAFIQAVNEVAFVVPFNKCCVNKSVKQSMAN